MAVFYQHISVSGTALSIYQPLARAPWSWRVRLPSTYKPERHDAHNVHHDMPAFAQDGGIERNEWLGSSKREKDVGARLLSQQSAHMV